MIVPQLPRQARARKGTRLDACTLAAVADLAPEFDVAGGVGPVLADGNDVVEFKPLPAAAVDARCFVASAGTSTTAVATGVRASGTAHSRSRCAS
jgi:hypothetical protein